MQKRMVAVVLALLLLCSSVVSAAAEQPETTVVSISADMASHEVSPFLYGTSLEDVNFGIEGGLHANLIRNNSFECLFGTQRILSGWTISGRYIRKIGKGIAENNPSYLYLPDAETREMRNVGFPAYPTGQQAEFDEKASAKPSMHITAGEQYALTIWFKETHTKVSAYLENTKGEKMSDTVAFEVNADAWTKYTVQVSAAKGGTGQLVIRFGRGDVNLDFVTLYPKKSYGYGQESWKYTALRTDLFEALQQLHPSFVRFDGGFTAEDTRIEHLSNWKETLGPLETRRQVRNPWQTEQMDYTGSQAIGYHEYFQLCEDIGAEPIPIFNAGMLSQIHTDYAQKEANLTDGKLSQADWDAYVQTLALTPGTPAWDAYVQDVLDLIEYAIGSPESDWGRRRAENGHPAPFPLHVLEIGRENWGPVYLRNLEALRTAIQTVYPQLQVIASGGRTEGTEAPTSSWRAQADRFHGMLVNEQMYQTDSWFLSNLGRYDAYPRDGRPIVVGQYAANTENIGSLQTKSNLQAALCEAAFMISLERNSDLVKMASYAPTLAKIDAQQWPVNLIWFNNEKTVRTPSYYNQMLFMQNTGTSYLDAKLPRHLVGVYQSVTVDRENEVLYIKLVNTKPQAQNLQYDLSGFGTLHDADMLTMHNDSQAACNTDRQVTVVPEVKPLTAGGTMTVPVDGYSINVIRVTYGNNTERKGVMQLPDMPKATKYYTPLQRALSIGVPLGVLVLAAGISTVVHIRKRKKELNLK